MMNYKQFPVLIAWGRKEKIDEENDDSYTRKRPYDQFSLNAV